MALTIEGYVAWTMRDANGGILFGVNNYQDVGRRFYVDSDFAGARDVVTRHLVRVESTREDGNGVRNVITLTRIPQVRLVYQREEKIVPKAEFDQQADATIINYLSSEFPHHAEQFAAITLRDVQGAELPRDKAYSQHNYPPPVDNVVVYVTNGAPFQIAAYNQ